MTYVGAFTLGGVAGFAMMFFSPSLTTQPSRDCQVFKVAKTPVTSYVLKPVVQEAPACKPLVVKEKCEVPSAPTVEEREEPKPRKRRHRRWWR
jgi:hypothetical protein